MRQAKDTQELATWVGANTRRFRAKVGMTQEQLAKALKLSANYLGLLERGQRMPSFDTIFTLGQVLRVAPSDLFKPPAR